MDLYRASEVIDLHVESFSFTRSFGYDLSKRHGVGWNRALLFGQVDFPRLHEARVTGGVWSLTANPLRPASSRGDAFVEQLRDLKQLFEDAPHVTFVRSHREFEAARRRGDHAAFIGVQGANALAPDPDFLDVVGDDLVKICLLHLTSSSIGTTSTFQKWPGGDARLGSPGVDLLRKMNERRILVDLAHIHPVAFSEAARHSDPSQPLVVSHTGVNAVHPHWRNLSDEQIRVVADSGGTIGVIYHAEFLGDGLFSGRVASVARHLKHVVDLVGDEHASLGSDWDGLICTPRDMPTCLELPRLVQALLDLDVPDASIVKILGRNFVRVLRQLDRESVLDQADSRHLASSSHV